MRVLLAFALLLGLSLTSTASAASSDAAACSVVEAVYSDVAPLADADLALSTEISVTPVETATAEQAREPDCYLVIIDYYDGDGNYLGSEVGILCFGA